MVSIVGSFVAIFNSESKTIHHPLGMCGHISFSKTERIHSWASAQGSHARRVGHACRSCVSMYGFSIPFLVKEDDDG